MLLRASELPLRVARSADDIREWVITQVAQSVNCDRSEVDPSAPLDSLGVDSLGAIGMTGGLAAYLGRDVPATLMWDYATIDAIAQGLADSDAARTKALPHGVVSLQAEGDRTPIFFFPGLGGHPVTFHHVAQHLGTSQPSYGLAVPGFDDEEQPLATVEAIAAAMITALRKVQPQGPYQLAGYSFGGFLAYEAARQLTIAGEKVATLAVYDTYAPHGRVSRPLWQRLLIHAQLFVTRPGRVAYLKERFRQLSGVDSKANDGGSEAAEQSPDAKLKTILNLNQQAVRRYQPLPYSGSMLLFLASDLPDYNRFYKVAPRGGWPALCGGEVQVISLDGGHLNLLNAEYAENAARLLQSHLLN